jgi:two-component system, NarL family, response regulator LiaR
MRPRNLRASTRLHAPADGASNAKLADALAINEKTVKSHIGNILSKLHLADRTEAVAFAWRNGLMKDRVR